jgi:hypothetical protein
VTMANRRHSARRIKKRWTYNVREAAKATGATSGTVRRWSKNGLAPVKGIYPTIFRGADIIEFFRRRESNRKKPCGPGRMFCFRCKERKTPAFSEVEFRPDGPKLGTLSGLCPDCAALMNRRTSLANLEAAAGGLKISMRCVDPRLNRTPEPNSNPHSEGG